MRLSLFIVALVMAVCWSQSLDFEEITYLPPLPSLAARGLTNRVPENGRSITTQPAPATAASSQPAHPIAQTIQ